MTAPYPDLKGKEPCLQTSNPDVFFDSEVSTAIGLCKRCPARRPCLAFALTHDVSGVWGATSEPTRREIRREHGIRAVPLHYDVAATRPTTEGTAQ